jgi:hypothetical protein
VSSYAPECTQQGGNNELLRGTDPGYIGALAESFCKGDLSNDQTAVLGQADLDDNNSWKTAKLDSIRVKFGFSHAITNETPVQRIALMRLNRLGPAVCCSI